MCQADTGAWVQGAMENKSLNIFNSRVVLASPETATDNDYRFIERVVAHEYFHNWTGEGAGGDIGPSLAGLAGGVPPAGWHRMLSRCMCN
jgi:hypothetical protein